jgi:hypothetical protein
MRFSEFNRRITEGDLSHFVEDDADHAANDALINTLREIQFSSDHAQVPKISVEALINLVRTKPGGEAFNLETLLAAKKNNEAVGNIVGDIKDDENGTKYVFIQPVEPDEAEIPQGDAEATQTAPEKTVASMANRALDKRA